MALPTIGVATPSSRKTQLDIDIEHITKFHQDRIKVHGVMLWTDRHTDITNIVVTLAGAREPITLRNVLCLRNVMYVVLLGTSLSLLSSQHIE